MEILGNNRQPLDMAIPMHLCLETEEVPYQRATKPVEKQAGRVYLQ